jgi:hypothetical protein
MATAPAPPAIPIDVSRLTAVYVAIRDRRSEIKRIYEAEDEQLKAQLETIEGAMLKHLNDHGMESVRTDAGTFYKQEEIKPNIVDDKAFFQWIKDNNAFDAMQRRVSVTFVKEFMDSHEGKLPPPGIQVSREYVCRVRKPK